ncbi:MAG: protein kinase [Ardenticatenaceae bacterium]|nr:protein kinase [Ardenticatenaceae bacterium]
MANITIGQEIGRYKIIEKLGRGGMAEVYKGYQASLDRHVAIKLMHAFLVSEQDFLARFQREAKAIARLNHPNIVSVYDFDTIGNDTYYLVMEYIGGGTLKEKLQELASRNEQLPLDEAVRITIEITDALAYAHKQGMIHRDIKPANIMLTETGKAVLTDFGIVKLVGGAQASAAYTATGALIGTPAYMAPEQALGKPGDERADIYSLGVMLFQMVTGKLPFDADTPLAVVMKHVNEPVPMPVSFNPNVPFRLQEVILKALEKEPERRFQSANEMVSALRRAQSLDEATAVVFDDMPFSLTHTQLAAAQDYETASGQTGGGRTAVVPPPSLDTSADTAEAHPTTATGTMTPPIPARRSPWLYAFIGLVVVVIIGSIIIFGNRGGGGEVEPTATTDAPIVLAAATDTPTSTSAPEEPTHTPTITLTPSQTPDIVASSVAAIVLTEEARPTDTPTPSRTPTATPTNTPNATATFQASCTIDVELVEAHPYRVNSFNTAPVSVPFPMYWTLKNSGTCAWPQDLQWMYVEGEDLAVSDEPVDLALEGEVLPDGEVEITADFLSPATVATFESTWQLVTADAQPFGSPITFTIRTYIPATATPTPTLTPEATATSSVEVTELNYLFEVVSCNYEGSDWSCHVRITPTGGAGGPYSVFVFDQPAGQATRLDGPVPYSYFARARRCANFNSNVRIIDDGVTPALEFSRHLFIDPDDYFAGGCTE